MSRQNSQRNVLQASDPPIILPVSLQETHCNRCEVPQCFPEFVFATTDRMLRQTKCHYDC